MLDLRVSVAVRAVARRTTPALLLVAALLVALLGILAAPASAAVAGTTRVVAPWGADANAGTADAPYRTLGYALTRLAPGDTLLVRGGTYAEQVRNPSIAPATALAPTTVAAWPGERPVVEGLLWLKGASYWTIRGINVTWSTANAPTEHMVKMTNGVGWSLLDGEIWGAHSYAGVLVASTVAGEPSGWRIAGNCIHDTYGTNLTNQDHLIYANTGLTAGPGVIERNLLFNALNGNGIKLAGAAVDSGGAANVIVRSNTIWNTAQSVLVGWQSTGNVLTGNLLGKTGSTYGNVRGYQLTGVGNVAVGNVAGLSRMAILNDAGYLGVADGGNTFPVDPAFDDVTSCGGFHPSDPVAAAVGRYAAVADATPVTTSTTSTTAPSTTTTSTTSTTAPSTTTTSTTAPASTTTTTAPASTTTTTTTSPGFDVRPVSKRAGYRMVASDGGIFTFGDAPFYGSTGDLRLNKPIVGMASTPTGDGYWLVASDGGIFAFGDAGFYGSTGAMHLNQPILGMASTPSGHGYWLTASDGGIFAFGDAAFYGSTGALRLNRPITGMTSTPSGQGYWLTASDGGIFAFGDAGFYGSTGDRRLPAEIAGMASAPDGRGYWLAGADGAVYAFGSAADLGGAVGRTTSPITDIARTDGGYWLAARDGSIYSFGEAPALGSMAGTRLSLPVVGMASVG
jgi:hypothetical protein